MYECMYVCITDKDRSKVCINELEWTDEEVYLVDMLVETDNNW